MDTRKKILIVDDEETIAWGISKTLAQSADLGVETAYTVKASQALTMLNNEKFDLVITDIRMPEMSGIDLLKEVKERYPETGVIIMTAYGSTEVQQEASKRGSIYYIEKPFDIKVLKKAISDFFTKKQEIRQNPQKEDLTGSEDSFKGNIGSLQLMDVVQMNCLGRITCTLKVADGQKDGIIVFKKGDIVHAETSGMVGKEAFFNIAGWKGGSFDMINEISTQVTILDHWEQLLIEALQVLDDGSQDNVTGDDDFDFDFGQPPSGTTVKANVAEDTPLVPVSPVDTNMDMTPNMDLANDTSNLLERMLKKTNADAAFIMTPDGFVIDRKLTDESLQIDQSGENIARTLSAMIALGENMYSGALDHVVLSFKNKYIIVKAIPNSDLLFVISAPSSHKLDNILPTVEAEAQNLTNLI